MVKRRTLSLPQVAGILGAAKAAGFDINNIIAAFKAVRKGDQNSFMDEAEKELEDVLLSFSDDPLNTSLKSGIGYALPIIGGKILSGAVGSQYMNIGKKFRIKFW